MDSAFTSLQGAGDEDPVDPAIVDQAIAWYVKLSSGVETPDDHAAFQRWRNADPEHVRAWLRLEAMGKQLQHSTARIAPAVTRKTLRAMAVGSPARRRVLKGLMFAGAAGGTAWLLRDQLSVEGYFADIHTATGERRTIVLEDGTTLLLNTASAIDVRFDDRQRLVHLLSGEVMATTAHDPIGRPFLLTTRDGTLTPLGTRFTVRRDDASRSTRLAVLAGQVDVYPRNDPAQHVLVSAGWQTRFTHDAVDTPTRLDDAAQSWTDGILTAERTRLADFLSELSRYRHGYLRCDPAVADLRLTGAYPLHGTDPSDRILASLEQTLPVRVSRVTRYWVSVGPR